MVNGGGQRRGPEELMPIPKKRAKPGKKTAARRPSAASIKKKAAMKTAARKGISAPKPAAGEGPGKPKRKAVQIAELKPGAIAAVRAGQALPTVRPAAGPAPAQPKAPPIEPDARAESETYRPGLLEPKWQKRW